MLTSLKKPLLNYGFSCILLDRISKIYILKLSYIHRSYITPYLNLFLIWNKGIAFGLFSFDKDFIYSSLTIIILAILVIILILIFKSNNFKSYCYTIILGGSIGNLFDRIYYSAVPDFIDFHINNFHWFIFNIADIFISIGVICLIYAEVFLDKKTKI